MYIHMYMYMYVVSEACALCVCTLYVYTYMSVMCSYLSHTMGTLDLYIIVGGRYGLKGRLCKQSWEKPLESDRAYDIIMTHCVILTVNVNVLA